MSYTFFRTFSSRNAPRFSDIGRHWDGTTRDLVDADYEGKHRRLIRERGQYEDLTIRERSRSRAQSRLIGGMP